MKQTSLLCIGLVSITAQVSISLKACEANWMWPKRHPDNPTEIIVCHDGTAHYYENHLPSEPLRPGTVFLTPEQSHAFEIPAHHDKKEKEEKDTKVMMSRHRIW